MRLSNLRFYVAGYLESKRFARPPIIIGGCERSGTTLLQSILSAHPRIHAMADELWAFCYGPPAGFGGRRPIRLSRLYKYLGQYPIAHEARRWCEKSPANVFFFESILEHFDGRVQLIQIVRDGRDVVSSMHPGDPDKPWVPIRRWIAAVEAGLPYRAHDGVLTIRYEDLIADYMPTTQRICQFLDEEFTPELTDWHANARVRSSVNLVGGAVGGIHTQSIRKFEAPDFPYRRIVEQLMAEPRARRLLEAYGYL